MRVPFPISIRLIVTLLACGVAAPAALAQATADVTAADLASLTDGTYSKITILGVRDASGPITLTDVVVGNSVITSVGGGSFTYSGPMADLLGKVFYAKSGQWDGSALRLTVGFQVPKMLGGMSAELQFQVGVAGLKPLGLKIHIPGTIKRDTFTIQNAYLEILPEEGKVGGGGLFAFGSMTKTFGGWIDFRSGIGPEIAGQRVDVTKFGAGAGRLAIPIGTTGAFLDYLSGVIQNSQGLSEPSNWTSSNFTGEYTVVMGKPFSVAGKDIYGYVFSGQGVWNVHDGSFDMTGSGKLFDIIETASMRVRYNPPLNISASGKFSLPAYSGDISLQQSNGSFTGSLSGSMSIPSSVPVVGGFSLADVSATLKDLSFSGKASVTITPEIPEVCIPAACGNVPPCFTGYGCDWCKKCKWGICSPPYPCHCGSRRICGPWICSPKVCTPAVPAVKASFGFTFNASSGKFSFDVGRTLPSGAAAPIDPSQPITFLTNWESVTGTQVPPPPTNGSTGSTAQYVFTIDEAVPGALFRVAYTSNTVTSVNMTVETPAGKRLLSSEGALPFGYAEHLGYSRFNHDAREHVILLVDPAVGTYRVTVENTDQLGEYAVQGLLHTVSASCGPVQVETAQTEGRYHVGWPASTASVEVYLTNAGTGQDSFPVTRIDGAANTGSYTLETTELDAPAGTYHVTLMTDDGINPIEHCVSEGVVHVGSVARPEPPGDVCYTAGDGGMLLTWEPSPSSDVVGYVVQWTEDRLGRTFDQNLYVSGEEATTLQAEVSGLASGVPVLARVLAVDADLHRSLPSEIVRVTPMGVDSTVATAIVSVPDPDATVGHNYVYVPYFAGHQVPEAHSWLLEDAPAGMTVDPASGIVQWTPGAEQVGTHDVALRLEIDESDHTASGTQTFQVHVYAAGDHAGLEEHAYHWLTHPPELTGAGRPYQFKCAVLGPDSNVRFQVVEGPVGMTIDPASGWLSWDVPADAKGHFVRLRAIVGNGHKIDQRYFLAVERADHACEPVADTVPEPVVPGCGSGLLPATAVLMLLFGSYQGRRMLTRR